VEAREITGGCIISYVFGTCAGQATCGGTCYLSGCDQFCPDTGPVIA
jgi:hypothetical protein